VSLSCLRTRELFSLYAAEALDTAARRELREHLASCEPCRAQAERADEGLLFAFAGAGDVTAEDVEQVLAGVRAGLDWRRFERRISPAPRTRGRRGFLAAAAALVAFTLAFPEISPRQTVSVPVRVSTESVRLEPAVAPEPAALDGSPAAIAPAAPANGTVPAKATVYDWNPGSGQPRVVWIVDRSLDI